jgi:mycoredoxin
VNLFRRGPGATAPGSRDRQNAVDRPTAGLTIYSSPWCGYCHRLRWQLDRRGVAYTAANIERDPQAAAYVRQVNRGNETVPTVVFADGTAMTNPSVKDVLARLAP